MHITQLRQRATTGIGGSGGGSSQININWLVSDHLGTPRMIADSSGSLAGIKRHDYLPFGEEIGLIGGRNAGQGYVADNTRQKFTGYESDSETGLNFAQARYQSSVQGRFISVDPLGRSASVASPQSFNRYSYVLNNPVNFTDLDGMMTMVDASMSYGDVSGLWGGGSLGFGGPETGRSIIAGRMGSQDTLIQARMAGMRALKYLQQGNTAAANAIFSSNSNVGRYVNGEVRWGSDATVEVSVSATVNPPQQTYSSNSTMAIVWDVDLPHTPGHVSYITMQDDRSLSWQAEGSFCNEWTKNTPSSDYTNERSKLSGGMGYLLDFGPAINAKFQ